MVDMDAVLSRLYNQQKCKVFSSLEVWFIFPSFFFLFFFLLFSVFCAVFVRWVKSVLLIYSCAHTQSAGRLLLEANVAVCQETCIIKCAKFCF